MNEATKKRMDYFFIIDTDEIDDGGSWTEKDVKLAKARRYFTATLVPVTQFVCS